MVMYEELNEEYDTLLKDIEQGELPMADMLMYRGMKMNILVLKFRNAKKLL